MNETLPVPCYASRPMRCVGHTDLFGAAEIPYRAPFYDTIKGPICIHCYTKNHEGNKP